MYNTTVNCVEQRRFISINFIKIFTPQNVWTVAELQIRKYMEGSGRDIIEAVSPHFSTADEKPSVKNEDKSDNKNRNRESDVWLTVHRNSVWIRKTN